MRFPYNTPFVKACIVIKKKSLKGPSEYIYTHSKEQPVLKIKFISISNVCINKNIYKK